MPAILWTGKLSVPMMLMVNANNILAWFTGSIKDTAAMKNRVQKGYDGAFSDHVTRYDELGEKFQTKAAMAQLEGVNLQGKEMLDVGCGTGIISVLVLQRGAAKVVCGDISASMLTAAQTRADRLGYGSDRITFRQLDAESLPFEDASFDFVMTGMTLGLLPDQRKAVTEMVRVLRPGCFLSVGAHGPEHYWEACDASFRAVTKRYVLGYRFEFWPQTEEEVRQLLSDTGITDIQTRRVIWRNVFKNGGEAYDFFAAISSNFWYAKIPQDKRDEENRKARDYFERKGIVTITDDIILADGRKL